MTGTVETGRAILGVPQWWILRRHLARAGWWIPANAAAWALGMVIVVIGAGSVPASGVSVTTLFFLLLTLAAAGAVVGAVHGIVLLWLTRAKLS